MVLHADVVDAAALRLRDEALSSERIRRLYKRFAATIARYHGQISEQSGDALLARFDRAADAVCAALAFQATQREYLALVEDEIRPLVRIGIASGEVALAEGVIGGPGVVLARRLEKLARPGAVNITPAVHEALPPQLPFDLESLGEPAGVYRIALRPEAGIPPPVSPRRTKSLQPMGTMRSLNRFLLLAIAVALLYAYLSAS